jgi:DNA adenine methylase
VLRNKAAAETSYGVDRDPETIALFATQPHVNLNLVVSSAEEFLRAYQFVGDEFVYLDPPYLPSARRSLRSAYRFDYTESEHVELLSLVRGLPCNAMISGYANQLYDRELKNWTRVQFTTASRIGKRTETVWLNYSPHLLHDTRFFGSSFRERQAIKRRRDRWMKRFQREPLPVQQALLAEMNESFRRRTIPLS